MKRINESWWAWSKKAATYYKLNVRHQWGEMWQNVSGVRSLRELRKRKSPSCETKREKAMMQKRFLREKRGLKSYERKSQKRIMALLIEWKNCRKIALTVKCISYLAFFLEKR